MEFGKNDNELHQPFGMRRLVSLTRMRRQWWMIVLPMGLVIGLVGESLTQFSYANIVQPLNELVAPCEWPGFNPHYGWRLLWQSFAVSGLMGMILAVVLAYLVRIAFGRAELRLRFRFRLRVLFAFLTIVALALGWITDRLTKADRQRRAVIELADVGAEIYYESHYDTRDGKRSLGLLWGGKGPAPTRTRLSQHLFNPVVAVDFQWAGSGWSQRDVKDHDLERLAAFPRLEKLVLNRNAITDEGLAHLSRLRKLRELCLCETEITDDGLRHLARLRNLESLALSGTPVTDDGLAHLQSLGSLKELYILDTRVTDRGLQHLSKLRDLRTLGLKNTATTDEGVAKLNESLPDCTIVK